MNILRLAAAVIFLTAGHFFKSLRTKQFIEVYEKMPLSGVLKALSAGYAVDFFIPFHIGDVARSIYLGKKTENGFPFALSTVIIDRFLDVAVVAIIFDVMCLFSEVSGLVKAAAISLTAALGGLVVIALLSLVFTAFFKRLILKLACIFNAKIEFGILLFTWSCISSVKNIAKTIPKLRLAGNTAVMWTMYLLSYKMYADLFTSFGTGMGLSDVLCAFFSGGSIFRPTLLFVCESGFPVYSLIYITAPLLMLTAVSFMMKGVIRENSRSNSLYRLLPQINDLDRHIFLQGYFKSDNPSFIRGYLEMSRDISIIKDHSSGSNAVTMLCMNGNGMFFRKYACSADGEKLRQQYDWLNSHRKMLPLAETTGCMAGDGYFCYDMPYVKGAEDLFRFIHTAKTGDSKRILSSIIGDLDRLHTSTVRESSAELLDGYISGKVAGNLDVIFSFRDIKQLMKYRTLIINGIEYENLTELTDEMSAEKLAEIFGGDRLCDIHGDLTIENIIAMNDGSGYYLIDSNHNDYSSSFLDFAKLLQSLHGNYEFYMMTKPAEAEQNVIDLPLIKSAAYEELFAFYHELLAGRFSESEMKSIYYHEIVHWLRLMPYKIRNDQTRALNFYCGLVIVANEVIKNEIYKH